MRRRCAHAKNVPTDILAKNYRAGICGTDIGPYLRGGDDVGIFPENQITHKFASETTGVGPEVKDSHIKPGLRIFVNPVNSKWLREGRTPY